VPHMGWNQLRLRKADSFITGVEPGSFVYFVHSYYAAPQSEDVILASTDHGIEFSAIVHHANIWATQFHPEKSQRSASVCSKTLVAYEYLSGHRYFEGTSRAPAPGPLRRRDGLR